MYSLRLLSGEELDRGTGAELEARYGLGRFNVSNGALDGHIIAKKYRAYKLVDGQVVDKIAPVKEEADAP